MNLVRHSVVAGVFVLLTGCWGGSAQSGFQDLDTYMADMRARPTGKIEPLPEFKPYEVFTYSAASQRSPFKQPIKVSLTKEQVASNVKPDLARAKQHLEQFEIDTLLLVGSISNDEGLWGLVRAQDGIHRVKVGDYLGRNFGRITYIDDEELRLTEIVPAGPTYWVERPRTLKVNGGRE